MSKVIIIGCGAAGMYAALAAADNGNEVYIYEKNEKPGKKIYITGKGRCNLTNASDEELILKNIVRNDKFLYSAIRKCNAFDVMSMFEEAGLPLKMERGNRVFPESDHSSDVIRTLIKALEKRNVKIYFHTEVKDIKHKEGMFQSILLANGKEIQGDACIVATGGLSYPSTGSTGDGYQFAKNMGHKIIPLRPSLVPMETKESFVKELQGLSLRNIKITIQSKGKTIFEEFGEMLFTHFGVTGPLILSASAYIGEELLVEELDMFIDLKPALSYEQLEKRVLRDFEENVNRQFKNAIAKLFPSKMHSVMINLSGIHAEKKVNLITKKERQQFALLIKKMPLTITKLRGYNEAVITKGGVCVKEIKPSTMESKLIKGVYFTGEVLDVDALTGGYNLQVAWTSGYAAGNSIF